MADMYEKTRKQSQYSQYLQKPECELLARRYDIGPEIFWKKRNIANNKLELVQKIVELEAVNEDNQTQRKNCETIVSKYGQEMEQRVAAAVSEIRKLEQDKKIFQHSKSFVMDVTKSINDMATMYSNAMNDSQQNIHGQSNFERCQAQLSDQLNGQNLNGKIEHLKMVLDEKNLYIGELLKHDADKNNEIHQLNGFLKDGNSKILELENTIKMLQQEIVEIKARNHTEYEELYEQTKRLEKRNNDKISECKILEDQYKSFHADKEMQYQNTLKIMSQTIEQLKTTNVDFHIKHSELTAEIASLKNEKIMLENLKILSDELQLQKKKLETQVLGLQNDIEKFISEKESDKNDITNLKYLLDEKNKEINNKVLMERDETENGGNKNNAEEISSVLVSDSGSPIQPISNSLGTALNRPKSSQAVAKPTANVANRNSQVDNLPSDTSSSSVALKSFRRKRYERRQQIEFRNSLRLNGRGSSTSSVEVPKQFEMRAQERKVIQDGKFHVDRESRLYTKPRDKPMQPCIPRRGMATLSIATAPKIFSWRNERTATQATNNNVGN